MMRRRRKVIWLTGVFLVLVNLGMKAGASLTLNFSLSVSESYNDNLFFTEENREADYTTSAGPFFNLTYSGKYFSLSGSYRGAAQFQAKHSDSNSYAQSGSFDLGFPFLSRQIRGFELQVTEKMSYTPVLPAFTFADEAGLIDMEGTEEGTFGPTQDIRLAETDTFENRAGVFVGYTAFDRFKTALSYNNIVTRFSNDAFEDSVVHIAGFKEDYRQPWSPRTEWTGSYSVSVTFYEEEDDAVGHRVGIGLSHRISRLLSFNGDIGVAFFHGESPRFTMDTAMVRRLKKGSFSIEYSGDVETEEGIVRETFYQQLVTGRASRSLKETLSTFLSLKYGNSRSLSGGNLNVSTYTAVVGLNFDLLSWLGGSLGYSYVNQQSEGTIGRDGERNLVTFSLTAAGPSWSIVK